MDNSHLFRELDAIELLDEDNKLSIETYPALNYIKNNDDLSISNFCDPEFYVKVKKKNRYFMNEPNQKIIKQNETISNKQQKSKNIKQVKSQLSEPTKLAASSNSQLRKKSSQIKVIKNQNNLQRIGIRKLSQQKVQNIKNLKNEQNPNAVEIKFIDKKHFVKINSLMAQLSQNYIKYIQNQFIRRQIFIPFFNINRFQQWQSSAERFDEENELFGLLKSSFFKYFEHLYQQHPDTLVEILQSSREIHQKNMKRPNWSLKIFNSVVNTFKNYMQTSKLQLLQRTLILKAKSIKYVRKSASNCLQISHLVRELKLQQEKIWKQIQDLQLLLLLESTLRYCQSKIGESRQAKIKNYWVGYKNWINKQLSKQLADIEHIRI